MGFTWAFDCPLYYRRAKLLSLALGSPREWKDRLITHLEARNDSGPRDGMRRSFRSEEHTSELQSHSDLVCRLLLEKKKKLGNTQGLAVDMNCVNQRDARCS